MRKGLLEGQALLLNKGQFLLHKSDRFGTGMANKRAVRQSGEVLEQSGSFLHFGPKILPEVRELGVINFFQG